MTFSLFLPMFPRHQPDLCNGIAVGLPGLGAWNDPSYYFNIIVYLI